MKKKFILAIIAILCVLPLTSCIVGWFPISQVVVMEVGDTREFQIINGKCCTKWDQHWHLGTGALVGTGKTCTFNPNEEGTYLLTFSQKNGIWSTIGPSFYWLESKTWMVIIVDDINAFNKNNPDFQAKAEEWIQHFEENWDVLVEDESLEYIEIE